jgi:hypothetical protein
MSNVGKKKEGGYEVGYLRPPKDRQFKKGQSGNPKGRPKRKPKPQAGQSLLEALREELDRPMTIEENGTKYEITTKEALVKQSLKAMMAGNPRSLNALRDLMPLIARAEAEQKAAESSTVDDRLNAKLDRLRKALGFGANVPQESDPE